MQLVKVSDNLILDSLNQSFNFSETSLYLIKELRKYNYEILYLIPIWWNPDSIRTWEEKPFQIQKIHFTKCQKDKHSLILTSQVHVVAYDNLINIFVQRIIFNNALLLKVISPVYFNIHFTIRRDSEMYSIVHCTIAS